MRIVTGCGLALALLAALAVGGVHGDVAAVASQAPQGTVTTGEVNGTNCGVVTACTSGLKVNFSPQMCGSVTAADGSRWDVPSAVHPGPAAVDVYNDCTGPGDIPDYLAQVKTVVVDPDGVEITGYVFADNYYELYVNGTFIAKDGMGMTPFNSTVVRFRAKYPITYAIKGVDWETHLGVGLEYDRYNVGDGGFIAHFSDGTITGPHWKVETFYIAPLSDPELRHDDQWPRLDSLRSREATGGQQGPVRSGRSEDVLGATFRDPGHLDHVWLRRHHVGAGHRLPAGGRHLDAGLRQTCGALRPCRVHLDAQPAARQRGAGASHGAEPGALTPA